MYLKELYTLIYIYSLRAICLKFLHLQLKLAAVFQGRGKDQMVRSQSCFARGKLVHTQC